MSETLKSPNELEKVNAVEQGGKYFFSQKTKVDYNSINHPPTVESGSWSGNSTMELNPGDIIEVIEKRPSANLYIDDVLRVRVFKQYVSTEGSPIYIPGPEIWTSSHKLMNSLNTLYLHKRKGTDTPLSTARADELADSEADVKQRAVQSAEETRQLMLRVFKKKKGE